MRVHEWQEWGNRETRSGTIVKVSYPVHWWLLEHLVARHPHWLWWQRVWMRLLPDWGDPLCAAYCFAWSKFYRRHEREEGRWEVGFDQLPEKTQANLSQ